MLIFCLLKSPWGLRKQHEDARWTAGDGGLGWGGRSTRLILISSVSLGRNTSGWDLMEGTRSLHVPFPNFCSFPHCFPVNLGWIQYEFFPRFFMPFMKTRSAFNAFLWPTPVFFFLPFSALQATADFHVFQSAVFPLG